MTVTLDDIVRGFLLTKGNSTLHGYLRYMKFLVEFMRKFAMKNAFMDKTVVLKLDQKKSIPFPEDFIMWKKIGWQSGDRIVAFENDQTINLHHATSEDGNEAPTANLSFNNANWPYNNRLVLNNFTNSNGENGELLAYGVGHNGLSYFRLNWRDREIQFSSEIPSNYEIYLEYKVNGFSATSKSVIPEIAAKLGEDYIYWQDARYKLGDAAVETESRRIAYFREYDELIGNINPVSIAGLIGVRARSFDINKIVY